MTARTTEEIVETALCLDRLEKSVETLADPECHYEHGEAESDAVTCIARLRALLTPPPTADTHACKHCDKPTPHPSRVCLACWGM